VAEVTVVTSVDGELENEPDRDSALEIGWHPKEIEDGEKMQKHKAGWSKAARR
jgi:hypothetical protein